MRRMISLLLAVVMMFGIVCAEAFSVAATTDPTAVSENMTEPETATDPEAATDPQTATDPEDPTDPQTATDPEDPTEPDPTEPEPDTGFVTSDECLRILKLEEGFSFKPYWDYSQYTVGFGTACPSDMVEYYMTHGITEAEAEVLLRNHLTAVERDINERIIEKYGLTLTQNQFDALVLFSYNVGTSWTYDSTQNIHKAIAGGATGNELIYWLGRWCRAGGEVKDYLLRRRLSEANMYLNGVYSQTPPENYCYVYLNSNGGQATGSVQTYDSDLTAQIIPTATYEGYTFKGWFTQSTGGTQVTVLDASTKGKTLYAQFADAQGNPPAENKETVSVTVTVTADDVNLRNGPGTNYTRIGTANKGDQFVITETASGSGYKWGKFDGGWICLQYTNFDEALKEQETTQPTEPQPTEPQPTEPQPTEPQPTEPQPTEPQPTEPQPTEPQPTEPQPTEPQPTEPETPKTVMGTVKVSDELCVRSGPGTGYAVKKGLKNGTRVEILEQQTVGHMVWGKIADGWISLSYVVLDQQESDSNDNQGGSDNSQTATWKGTVKANGGLWIRTGPGVSYSIAGYLDNGSQVEILEQQTIGSVTWGKTAKGWVSMNYIVLNSQSGGNAGSTGGTTATETLKGTVKVSSYLRVRTGPGTSYAIAAYLPNGETVEITERKTVGSAVWGKTAKGWVSLDYVELDSQGGSTGTGGATQTVTKTVTASCLNVRSNAGTSNSIVGYLYYGSKVEILETTTVSGTTWGRISNGWICLDYTK